MLAGFFIILLGRFVIEIDYYNAKLAKSGVVICEIIIISLPRYVVIYLIKYIRNGHHFAKGDQK